MVLGRPLSILGIVAQQLPPRLSEANGNFDRNSHTLTKTDSNAMAQYRPL